MVTMDLTDLDSWEILNVVDTRGDSPNRRTIAYNGELHPTKDGFTHSFRYRTRKGSMWGCGIVVNPEYSAMSSAEIVLKLTADDPVTPEDLDRFVEDNEIVRSERQA